MSMISRMPTECSSSPTVAATTLRPCSCDEVADLLVGERDSGGSGITSVAGSIGDVEPALELDQRALGRVHDALVDDLARP